MPEHRTLTLSPRKYSMLKSLLAYPNEYWTVEEVGTFNQGTFRSMLYQGWVVYHRGKGFKVHASAKDAMAEFERADIYRKVASLQLTSYFDYKYGRNGKH